MVIVNTAMSYVINLHGQYVLYLVVFLVIGAIEHRGQCSLKGVGFVTTLIKKPVFIWFTMVKKINKGNGKGFRKTNSHFWHFIYENNGN